MTKEGKTAFIALGSRQPRRRGRRRSHQVTKYLLVGQRVWHMAFTPDEKYLLVTNGVSNDVSVIDVAAQKGDQDDPSRRTAVGHYDCKAMTAIEAPAASLVQPDIPSSGRDPASVPALSIGGVSHSYGPGAPSIDVNFTVAPASFTALLG